MVVVTKVLVGTIGEGRQFPRVLHKKYRAYKATYNKLAHIASRGSHRGPRCRLRARFNREPLLSLTTELRAAHLIEDSRSERRACVLLDIEAARKVTSVVDPYCGPNFL